MSVYRQSENNCNFTDKNLNVPVDMCAYNKVVMSESWQFRTLFPMNKFLEKNEHTRDRWYYC